MHVWTLSDDYTILSWHEYHVCCVQVIHDINKVNEASKTIFVASEENMDEALSALKKGMRTFSTDWFMNCIMMQQLDLEAPQFAESL